MASRQGGALKDAEYYKSLVKHPVDVCQFLVYSVYIYIYL